MRLLEILLPLLLAAYILAPCFTRSHLVKYIPVLALLVSIVHLGIEGYRWQMIPLYVLTAAFALANLTIFFKADSSPDPSPRPRAAASILTLGLVALATALPALLPVPRIANPSGPFPVGTRSIVLTDASRKELYSGRDEPRRFMVQVWYPAEPGRGDVHAPWVNGSNVFAPAIAKTLGLPQYFLDHLALAKSPAFQNARLAPTGTSHPIIVFSHGWSGFSAQSTAQMVELASHGYVVIGMQHTYGAVVTIFPDGTVAPENPDALPEDMPEPGYTDTARKLVDQWSGDIAFALDYFAEQNSDPSSPFHAALDLNRVGVFGHSTGGGAAIQFCGSDPRCIAGLAEDPFMTPVSQAVQEHGLSQPFLFLFSQAWRDNIGSKNNQLFDAFLPKLTQPVGVATILGTKHYDFTDLPLFSPLAPQLGLKGPINGKRVVQVINDYLVAYFEQELNGVASPLPFGASEAYPELRWETK